jgi:hypothetical protein
MRSFESFGNLHGKLKGFFDGYWPGFYPIRQSLSFHQLKDEEVCIIECFQAVNGSNVGMVQGGKQFGFALKPGNTVNIPREFFRQDFDSYLNNA